jgi:Ca2+-binding EF-hand superfamily protein
MATYREPLRFEIIENRRGSVPSHGERRRYGVGVSDAEVAAMVREADRDGSGCVSRDEYFAIMKNAGWF